MARKEAITMIHVQHQNLDLGRKSNIYKQFKKEKWQCGRDFALNPTRVDSVKKPYVRCHSSGQKFSLTWYLMIPDSDNLQIKYRVKFTTTKGLPKLKGQKRFSGFITMM